MLTADLISARVFKGEVRPRYVDVRDAENIELAQNLITTFREHVGRTRDALDGALAALLGDGTEFLLHRGLSKLLFDKAEFEVKSPCEPVELRRKLFEEAARHHPAVLVADAVHTVTRDDVLKKVAGELGIAPEAVTAAMYADLEAEHVMVSAPDMTPEALLTRYNVALAQAALLRATGLSIEMAPGDPQRYRQMFRYIKFYRLMHTVTGTRDEGYMIRLDGPLSLFQLSQKYGLQLAEFLPALLLCPGWTARADLLWGTDKKPMTLKLSSEQGLVSHYPDKGVYITREEQFLIDRFAALDVPWTLERRSEVIDLGGHGVLIPEFVLVHKTDARVALVDVMGFWKREYLDARLKLLRQHAPKNLILAVPWKLRGSEDELKDTPAEVMFFKDVILAKELVERAEKVGVAPAVSPSGAAAPKKRGKSTRRGAAREP